MGKTISEAILDSEAVTKAMEELRAEEDARANRPKSMPLEPMDELRMKVYDIEQRVTTLERTQHDNF